ncbi:hypothetical protein [Bradyrhizobium canariense]|nr:hypothetical protein [Bradyrhizobium canariense]
MSELKTGIEAFARIKLDHAGREYPNQLDRKLSMSADDMRG